VAGVHISGHASPWTPDGYPSRQADGPRQNAVHPRLARGQGRDAAVHGSGYAGAWVHGPRRISHGGGRLSSGVAPRKPVVAGRAKEEDEGRHAGGGHAAHHRRGSWKGGRRGRCNAALHPQAEAAQKYDPDRVPRHTVTRRYSPGPSTRGAIIGPGTSGAVTPRYTHRECFPAPGPGRELVPAVTRRYSTGTEGGPR